MKIFSSLVFIAILIVVSSKSRSHIRKNDPTLDTTSGFLPPAEFQNDSTLAGNDVSNVDEVFNYSEDSNVINNHVDQENEQLHEYTDVEVGNNNEEQPERNDRETLFDAFSHQLAEVFMTWKPLFDSLEQRPHPPQENQYPEERRNRDEQVVEVEDRESENLENELNNEVLSSSFLKKMMKFKQRCKGSNCGRTG